MSINLTESGESIYTQNPIAERANNSVYRTIQALDLQTNQGPILDIGSSDGVVNHQNSLADKKHIVGLDLSFDAIAKNEFERPIQGDAINLPFKNDCFTSILALDIIEHFPFRDAINVLNEIKRVGKIGHQVIISMPIVDPSRIMTWVEGYKVIKQNERPAMGLFDRTHHILRGTKYHKKIFDKSGYVISDAYDTIAHTNASRSVYQKQNIVEATAIPKPRNNIKSKIVGQYTDKQYNQGIITNTLAYLLAYQRIYVLQER